ncbi:flagellar filament capping protein FliD [Luteimonas sp. RD2P54]|uniref:Flagellar hook-associated protein 2 n=1 Tax=Luteimonas endophytica TaxID=3042023 RepID=A0ABT6J831_9GAMM|nr:flagellar filament capping protein FliD [Luteimonas endophytica]MDH5822755.1 flagellar filament capping protein FliD [Luteimonas endophytica]
MADYSFGYGGIGSGIDISSMVSQLVAADRAPQDARLAKLESAAKFKLSGVGSVSSAFDALKTALDALKKSDAMGARTVGSVSADSTSGTDNVLSASVGKGTPAGQYQIEVLALASAHKLMGAAVPSGTLFDAGQLSLSMGGESVTIDIATGSSLADIRSAINDKAASLGVQASLLTSDDGQHLSVASTRTGAANAVSIQLVEGGGDLSTLVGGLQQKTAAADARVSIDGLITTSEGNAIADAVPGMTLALKATGTSTVTVATDAAASRKPVEDVVKAYNAAIKAIATATSYNKETDTPSSLTGDAQMRGAAGQLRAIMGDLLGELAVQGLDARTLGLQTRAYPSSDGTLVLDSAKFDAAMAANPGKITAAFSGSEGFAARLSGVVEGYVGTDGSFTLRTKGINDQLKDVARQRESVDLRMEATAKRYQAQFVALDSLMAQMSTTSNYLSQQLAALSAQLA